ncbi:MAG: filamentous hemagglutinin N-terminal domain-containing protein [Nostoc sp. DedQUE04]|uniref:two-partner secretion domain-containing protein n=1 Tax=Nostoc sp. DedQUE04 TaxID=3075390 RepID=UPI002AD3D55F|nr:filamentous hemagglutinin N-terminal domain-containing protein [Nostoc sp. DedQUE04]MDZ8140981.1 filamentous hemagglutinin N-terminal domain-containing protein [Nostoc sp. DedQUE04]
MQHSKRSLLSNTLPLSIGVNFALALFSCIVPCPAKAQITPDATLGNKNSVVVPDNLNGNPIERINGGAIQGSNLFHSFLEFNIGEGARAYFSNTSGISNILTRVTGNNPSNILGTLGVLGNANLFLINPKGIVFGPNASLDLRGSFVASSADSLVFNNGLEFSATNPEAPPLLTVNIPVGLRLRENSASIVNQSSAVLDLPSGNTLGLVGGNVSLDGGKLRVAGGRIELGGLSGAGIVGFDIQESQGIARVASLSFPNNVERANVFLSNEAVVNVASGGGGSIAINSRNVNIVGGSRLLAGIDQNSGSPGTQAGNIEINATEQVVFTGVGLSSNKPISGAFNQVETGAQGNSGDINIKATSLEVREGAQLSASTSGNGNAGKILINAEKQVLFDGGSNPNNLSYVYSQVEKGAQGNSGGIEIKADSLTVTNGAQLSSSIKGSGEAGTIRINTDKVLFDGESATNNRTALLSQVVEGAVGKSGDIEIQTRILEVTNGASLDTSIKGSGEAGAIRITATDKVLLDGESKGNRTALLSQVVEGAIGKSGDIEITTPILEVTNSAFLDTSTKGSGNAGAIRITATDKVLFDGETDNDFSSAVFSQVFDRAIGKSGDIEIKTPILEVRNGAFLDASTLGSGNAGTITIKATDNVLFDGKNNNGLSTYAGSISFNTDEGKSGSIVIETPILKVTNGAKVITTTFGKGNSGLIQVTATDSVVVDGTSTINSEVRTGATGASEGITIKAPRLQISNAAIVSANSNGNGNAGNIDVTSDTIELSSAGQIRTNTSASSKAGNITLNVPNTLTLSDFGTAVLAETENTSSSNGGNISVIGSPKNVLIQNGAKLSVNSKGSGTGGNIFLEGNSLTLDQGTISAETAKETGGNISLEVADLLLMEDDSKITTSAGLESQPGAIGTGGNIKIDTQLLVAAPSKPKGSDITANATYGNGGRVDITATGIFGIEFRDKPRDFLNDITASSEFGGNAGVVNINQVIDPSRNLVELPANVIDPNDQIAQNPCSKGVASEFTIAGRGGLPPSPNEDLSQEATQVALVEPVSIVSNVKPPQKTSSNENSKSQIPSPMVPVKGWVFNNKGEVILTAYNPNVIGIHRLPKNLNSCPAR